MSIGLLSRIKFRYHLYTEDDDNRIRSNSQNPWGLQLRSLGIFGEVNFSVANNLQIISRYRAAQLLHNDPNLINTVLFSSTDPSNPPPSKFQFFNPIRLEIAFAYKW